MQYAEKFTLLQFQYTVKVTQSLRIKDATSVLRALPIASTERCAFQCGLVAFAPFHAAFLAVARNELPADLGCLGYSCPQRTPLVLIQP